MKLRNKLMATGFAALAIGVVAAGCSDNARDASFDSVHKKAEKRAPYIPVNGLEFNNYNRAQRIFDDPSNILWCTTTWGNASAPLVTVPIAGKLTSSSVSFFSNYDGNGNERESIDGMFHGSPPPYRFGFTPGGQYTEFFNMPALCTTALTEFQRQSTKVQISVDPDIAAAQNRASQYLKQGKPADAQKALVDALAGG